MVITVIKVNMVIMVIKVNMVNMITDRKAKPSESFPRGSPVFRMAIRVEGNHLQLGQLLLSRQRSKKTFVKKNASNKRLNKV